MGRVVAKHALSSGLVLSLSQTHHGGPQRWRPEDHKFKVIFSYIASLREAWAT